MDHYQRRCARRTISADLRGRWLLGDDQIERADEVVLAHRQHAVMPNSGHGVPAYLCVGLYTAPPPATGYAASSFAVRAYETPSICHQSWQEPLRADDAQIIQYAPDLAGPPVQACVRQIGVSFAAGTVAYLPRAYISLHIRIREENVCGHCHIPSHIRLPRQRTQGRRHQ
jgi:hypothetical protein